MSRREDIMKVRDLMTKSLISIEADKSVIEAAKLMDKRNISSILVRSPRGLMGIITDRDLISRVVSRGLDPKEVLVREVMSSPIITVNTETSIEEAAEKMRRLKIRRLLVEEDDNIVGLIGESDIVRITPELHFLIREQCRLEVQMPEQEESQEVSFSGFCEECGNYSEKLENLSGRWICEDCKG